MNKLLFLIFMLILPLIGRTEVQCQTNFETRPGIKPGFNGFEDHFIAYGPTFGEACAKAIQNCENEIKKIPPEQIENNLAKGIHCQTGYCIFVVKEKRGPISSKFWGGDTVPINSLWAHLDQSNKNATICPALEYCKKEIKNRRQFCGPYGDYKNPNFKGQ